jgi:hypothetical protein
MNLLNSEPMAGYVIDVARSNSIGTTIITTMNSIIPRPAIK